MARTTKGKFDSTQTDSVKKQIALESGVHQLPKTKWRNVRRGAKVIFVIVFFGVVALSYKLYKELRVYKNAELQAAQQQQEAQRLTETVGKLIILPDEEAPVIATVNDADALASQQTFYKNAVNGDKLLIYTTSQKAILYSPSRKMIVNVGPFVSKNPDENSKTDSSEAPKQP